MNVPATGTTATVTGMTMLHVEDGKAITVYSQQDILWLLERLDAILDSPRQIVRLMVGQLKSRLGR